MSDLHKVFEYLSGFLTEERLEKINHFALTSSAYILPVLEDVYQFRNAAAIVRSVEACGFHKVVALQDKNSFEPNIKVTKGADTWVEVEKMPLTKASLQVIKDRGYRLVAVSPERNATSLPDFSIQQPTALLFGTEWNGVSEDALEMADETLMIPMYGWTKSFNVSVAAAICMYELKQKLIHQKTPHFLTEEQQLELKIRWAINSIRSGDEIYERYLRLNHESSTK
ncbi:RNA methyltransferase [Bergeyella zoohelcum]|uniref:TrmH family RNA methyltransferase n=1 Tax=Bergeyella zoohelcum TaxID=1015 RepID=UPI002A90F2EC|nr:RNA methyltransferase [Bergeyella zoohelcum]MDY6025753.1 RNA methyltransferase [Bergeyella zoohelcum]